MSLYVVRSSLLSFCPRITVTREAITASSCFIFRLLSLFSYKNTVLLERTQRIIEIKYSYLWGLLKKNRFVRYQDISHIETSYKGIDRSWHTEFDIVKPGLFAIPSDKIDIFKIFLRLKNDKKVLLLRFSGEGSQGGLKEALWGDDFFDLEGNQADTFRIFLHSLEKELQVPIGKPLESILGNALSFKCTNCDQTFIKKLDACLYCGHAIQSI
jgi:hypothetical protein